MDTNEAPETVADPIIHETNSDSELDEEEREHQLNQIDGIFRVLSQEVKIEGTVENAWKKAERLSLREKIVSGELICDLKLPIINIDLEKNENGPGVNYSGQDPRGVNSFVGKLESSYGIKEGLFCKDEDAAGGMTLHGYGRVFFPFYTAEGLFFKGK